MILAKRDEPRLGIGRDGEGRGPPGRIRGLTLHQSGEIEPLRRIGLRDSRQQRVGVRVDGIAEQHFARRHLDDLAGAHHHDPVGDIVHHREVVRDEQIGDFELLLQILQQVEDLGLDRDIQRRDRLVADQELGLERQRPRNTDALALTAGETVGVAVERPDIQAHQFQKLLHHLGPERAIADAMDEQRFIDDVEDGHPRIERPERVLEDELDLAPERYQLRLAQADHIDQPAGVVERELAFIRRHGPHQTFAQRRLAAAALAHQAETLATPDLEIDGIDGGHQPTAATAEIHVLANLEPLGQAARGDEGAGGAGTGIGAAFAGGQQVGRLKLDLANRRQPFVGPQAETRHRPQQCPEVRVAGVVEYVLQRAALHDAAPVQNHDLLGDVGDHAEVMGDHQNRHAELGLQVTDQFQDLGLDGDVKRGRRFVGDQQCRAADQSHGDHRPLAQPAR